MTGHRIVLTRQMTQNQVPRTRPSRPRMFLRLLQTALLSGGLVGCATVDAPEPSTTVRHIRISDRVTPRTLFAKIGDEVRWHNELATPVQLSILEGRGVNQPVCEKGFRRFGQLTDLVTIPPHDYASLCFSKAATIRYNVWLDLEDRRGSMTPTAKIRVD